MKKQILINRLAIIWTLFTLLLSHNSFADCKLNTEIKDAGLDEIEKFYQDQQKEVVTFVGYSGAGYEDEQAMLETAKTVLTDFNPQLTIVNIGATIDGIGAVYEQAKQLGFVTTGIVSSQAKEYKAELSPCVDHVFYVQDDSWGGFLGGTTELSDTSTAMVNNSDVMIGIGGGQVAADELTMAKQSGKQILFFSADMNHQKARDKAKKKGLPEPMDFSGAAGQQFTGEQN